MVRTTTENTNLRLTTWFGFAWEAIGLCANRDWFVSLNALSASDWRLGMFGENLVKLVVFTIFSALMNMVSPLTTFSRTVLGWPFHDDVVGRAVRIIFSICLTILDILALRLVHWWPVWVWYCGCAMVHKISLKTLSPILIISENRFNQETNHGRTNAW